VGVLQLAVPAEVVDDLHLPHGPRRRRPGRVSRPAPLRARLNPAAAHPPPFPSRPRSFPQLRLQRLVGGTRRFCLLYEEDGFGEKRRKWNGNGDVSRVLPLQLLCMPSRRALCGFRKNSPHLTRPCNSSKLYFRVRLFHRGGRPLGSCTVQTHGDVEADEREAPFCSARCVIDREHGGVLLRIDGALPHGAAVYTCARGGEGPRGRRHGPPSCPGLSPPPPLFLALWRVGRAKAPCLLAIALE
jgi:hypothetical protein